MKNLTLFTRKNIQKNLNAYFFFILLAPLLTSINLQAECFICSDLEPALLKTEVSSALESLSSWELDTSSGSKLSKTMTFSQPDDMVDFIEKIDCFSCKNYHKVEFIITPKSVTLAVYDAFLRTITRSDITFAKKVNSFITSSILTEKEKSPSLKTTTKTEKTKACCQSCADHKPCEGKKENQKPACSSSSTSSLASSSGSKSGSRLEKSKACCQSCADHKPCEGKKENQKPGCSSSSTSGSTSSSASKSSSKTGTSKACCQSCAGHKPCEGKKENQKPGCSSSSTSGSISSSASKSTYKSVSSKGCCRSKTNFKQEKNKSIESEKNCCSVNTSYKEKEKNIIALYNQQLHEISKQKFTKDKLFNELTTHRDWSSMNLGTNLMRKWFVYENSSEALHHAKLVVRMYLILRRNVEVYLYDNSLRVDFKKNYNELFTSDDYESIYAVDLLIEH